MQIDIQNLRRDFRAPDNSLVPVIDVPSLHLDPGQQLALMGSSGSGKTTLLHLLAGILTPDSGSIVFQSQNASTDITTLSEAQRDHFRGQHVGYVFQTSLLIPAFTALENVLLGMSFTNRPQDKSWAMHLLTEVGLKDRAHFRPGKLSVGQQQRVAVARALANRPDLVLADEPTGALDAKSAVQIVTLIQKLAAEVGAILIMVTHDSAMAARLPQQKSLLDLNRAAIGATSPTASAASTTTVEGR
jgi:ABC-type lipoprotein export system ATPase subunit